MQVRRIGYHDVEHITVQRKMDRSVYDDMVLETPGGPVTGSVRPLISTISPSSVPPEWWESWGIC